MAGVALHDASGGSYQVLPLHTPQQNKADMYSQTTEFR
jgi:hypothetical protein